MKKNGLVFQDITLKDRVKGALVKTGLIETDWSLTKRSYLLLLIGGNGYVFLLLFSFLLGYFGETILALSVFFLGLFGAMKIFSLKQELIRQEQKKGRLP